MNRKFFFLVLITGLYTLPSIAQTPGTTTITEWQYGKNGAVSLTYDDASRHQFTRALPVMERLKLPATFFVITGPITGSKYQGKFIGRPVGDIIKESATIPTSDQNFLERCSAAGYLGYKGTISYHTRAGGMYDSGRKEKAFKLMDSLYAKVRNGDFPKGYEPCPEYTQAIGSTWDDFRKDAAKGYEIASHSITHATMPGMDEANIKYELEKSKEEILKQMGPKYTFSAEVPYGYENERVMQIAYKIYPALRNRMPEPWLKEIDRSSRKTPGPNNKDYVQWQRGATTKTPLPLMKSWVDTAYNRNDTWLVLVFHGVDSLGYEALNSSLLDEYFQYIKGKQDKLWVTTFGDATRYMREREAAKTASSESNGKIKVTLTHGLDKTQYYLPLTLKTYVPANWKLVHIEQGKHFTTKKPEKDDKGSYVLYQAEPNGAGITLSAR
ncbi:polysaccharide deacetylase family protein [Mucilaginibacter ginsenosidivorans]|uniref:Polysaccharide deacetylase family protein n=1 Tax=Mucilaginibacter ginsenosidivorans TaxID=398053 RepID=A0A5B8V077_9SPHI|nr:polysaccharide deacetylase family protein [Mucilaginibacter ginsenosidivorans]QEC64662.1 polysaccharide deacetylase family protein [Mucilaginibacter ginsenosidivorans]